MGLCDTVWGGSYRFEAAFPSPSSRNVPFVNEIFTDCPKTPLAVDIHIPKLDGKAFVFLTASAMWGSIADVKLDPSHISDCQGGTRFRCALGHR